MSPFSSKVFDFLHWLMPYLWQRLIFAFFLGVPGLICFFIVETIYEIIKKVKYE